MKERPVIFSAPMVRAILEGRKTQTRRVAKLNIAGRLGRLSSQWHPEHPGAVAVCPYGQPGDRLWVRETWAVQRAEPCEPHERDWQDLHSPIIRYLADGATRKVQGNRSTGSGIYHGPVEKTRVSIHMPRWASRILLEITDVRVERVQAIDDGDALEEGIHTVDIGSGYSPQFSAFSDQWQAIVESQTRSHDWPRDAFRDLWNAINALRGFGWYANPWVWAITFKRVEDGERE